MAAKPGKPIVHLELSGLKSFTVGDMIVSRSKSSGAAAAAEWLPSNGNS